jgi:hypothetical protein
MRLPHHLTQAGQTGLDTVRRNRTVTEDETCRRRFSDREISERIQHHTRPPGGPDGGREIAATESRYSRRIRRI